MGEFRREVLPPRAVGGLTVPVVVVVATLLVSLAMAAMAMVPRPAAGPRARVVPKVAPATLYAIDIELVPMTHEQAARCREPVRRALADGTVETTFELCGAR